MARITQWIHIAEVSRNEEVDLVIRIRAGDQNACSRLVRLFGPRMMAVAHRFMQCEEDCNDALQDAFISAFKALGDFEANSRLSTWLYRITVNSCLMKLRRGSFHRESSSDELFPALSDSGYGAHRLADIDNPASELEAEETRTAVRQAIEQLPEAYRAVLLLRDIEGMDTAATAARLETSPYNVKRRLCRARRALCTLLEPLAMGDRALPA